MIPRLRLAAWLALFGAGLLTGCVERRFVITTDPPGAIVYDETGRPLGAAPTDKPFVYYGEYQFTLVRDGYETQVVREKVRAPWYEWIFLDFFSENLIPWTIRDVRRFHYQLPRKQEVPPEAVLQQAEVLRQRGLATGIPLTTQPAGPGPVSSTLMPPVP